MCGSAGPLPLTSSFTISARVATLSSRPVLSASWPAFRLGCSETFRNGGFSMNGSLNMHNRNKHIRYPCVYAYIYIYVCVYVDVEGCRQAHAVYVYIYTYMNACVNLHLCV